MSHPENWQDIDAYARRMLGEAESRAIEEHARASEDCARRIEGATQDVAALRAIFSGIEPPEDIVGTVMARLGQGEP